MNQANTGAEQTVAGLERTATRDENAADFEFPQREAAFFYGLFLRGHHPDALRNDIRVPAEVLAKWNRGNVVFKFVFGIIKLSLL